MNRDNLDVEKNIRVQQPSELDASNVISRTDPS